MGRANEGISVLYRMTLRYLILRGARSSIRERRMKPINAGNFYRRDFQPLLERAGLADEGFTFHSLRHTFATTLAAKGVHSSTAQKMLGHSDIRMTLAIYTHVTDDMQDAAIAALESTLS
jgi:integrase